MDYRSPGGQLRAALREVETHGSALEPPGKDLIMNDDEPAGEVGVALSASAESASQTAQAEAGPATDEVAAAPDPVKANALMRLQRLEGRGKTVGFHLDEMRELLTILFRRLPD